MKNMHLLYLLKQKSGIHSVARYSARNPRWDESGKVI